MELVSFCIAFVLGVIIYLFLIPLFRKKARQALREEGPEGHKRKNGTPTLGGLGFGIACILTFVIIGLGAGLRYQDIILILVPFILLMLTGFCDDYLIIKRGKNDGLAPKTRIYLEIIIGMIFYFLFDYFGYDKLVIIDLGIIYLPLCILLFTGFSNAVNLADGLDGLCGGLSIIAYLALGIISYQKNNMACLLFSICICGGLLAFLVFNVHPAQIFMGDTGSLALGGGMVALACILKVEPLFLIIGFPFIIETLSVICQVLYYKKTKKRIFRMAPIHHHFELLGYKETSIVFMSWLIGIICSLIGLIIFKNGGF